MWRSFAASSDRASSAARPATVSPQAGAVGPQPLPPSLPAPLLPLPLPPPPV